LCGSASTRTDRQLNRHGTPSGRIVPVASPSFLDLTASELPDAVTLVGAGLTAVEGDSRVAEAQQLAVAAEHAALQARETS